MTQATTLSDTIDEYLRSRRSQGLSENTIRMNKTVLKMLLAHVGNIQTRSIESRHIDSFFAARADLKDGTRNQYLTQFRVFFLWCLSRGITKDNPVSGRRMVKVIEEEKLKVPVDRFEELLDAAAHPRDRIIIALGLYLFLRASEMQALRVGNVDLDNGEIHVVIRKTRDRDIMPICEELDIELRRWLTFYAENIDGPLTDGMYLVPATRTTRFKHGGPNNKFVAVPPDEPGVTKLYPTRPVRRVDVPVNRALSALGLDTRQAGGHTLRRSGARALFDATRDDDGIGGALQGVKVMMHHKSVTMTERYIGVAPDRERRNIQIKGKRMFAPKGIPANVIELKRK